MRIYTRTGDDGTTGLIGGQRVSKDSPRIEANGSLDELNALIGLARSFNVSERVDRTLQLVQNDIFTLGTELAIPAGGEPPLRQIRDQNVQRLEQEIDGYQKELESLSDFVVPGGSRVGAVLHLARAVARRAERRCVALSRVENISPVVLRYLNRLSDLCFVLARFSNQSESVPEFRPTTGD